MKNRLITSVLMGIVSMSVLAQVDNVSSRPKLVVGIMVDQLRTDYVEYLQSLFGEKGFKKLMNEGVYFRNIDFEVPNLDAVSSTAMVFTGNYPSKTGITSAYVYSPETLKEEASLNDPSSIGNFTTETYSPRALLLSTIADELKIDGENIGVVYSLSSDPQQAIVMAGHAGNSAFWINENTGKWSTSTYYKDLPSSITKRNYENSISSRLRSMRWEPSLDINKYIGISEIKREYPFSYIFLSSNKDVYKMFATSPLGNEEITSVAIDYLIGLKLGNRGESIDMLNIGYTLAPFSFDSDEDYRLELQDAYIRLDEQLGRLFEAIDKNVGLNNTLIFLSSTGYFNDATKDDDVYNIPTGDFSVKRATSLLNSYLVALHGNGNYVKSYNKGQFYLNHSTIEDKQIPISEVAVEAKLFLRKMSGISDAYTLKDVLSHTNPELEGFRLSVDPKRCGDIFIEVTPGWNIVDDSKYPPETKPVRYGKFSAPAFIFSQNIKSQTINTPVAAIVLAPTITQILRIRSPNGAISKPLPL